MSRNRTRRRRHTNTPFGSRRDREFWKEYERARATGGPYPDKPRVKTNGNSWWEWPLVMSFAVVIGILAWRWRGIEMAIISIIIVALVMLMRTLLGVSLVLVIGLLVLGLFVLVAFNASPL